MDRTANHTFDELRIGDSASLTHVLTYQDVELVATMHSAFGRTEIDAEFGRSASFRTILSHGLSSALVSTLLHTELPGAGTEITHQALNFRRPVSFGDSVTATIKVSRKDNSNHHVFFDCTTTNQRGEIVADGIAEVICPAEKVLPERNIPPASEPISKGRHHQRLVQQAKGLKPIRTAVVHPIDTVSLSGAIEAAKAHLIIPLLIGPEAKIRAAAEQSKLDLSGYELVPTEHSHAAAAQAVALARDGKVEALMKGSLHTDEFMGAIVAEEKLRTARRMSHVFVIDAPGYPRPLFMTDAAINIYPTLDDKVDIVQNAIDLAHALGIPQPRVAILSAVEMVTSKIHSTLDAAALCKMADRGQITGGILDGPLAFDNAVSEEAAKTKGIVSPVAGRADIFVVPDLESGNMLAKQLEYLADADIAGIVLGARIPIILTSRADKTLARLGSCAIAVMLAHRGKEALS
ncbi:MAG: bifunctional enoyl-CoA hydratase/phosphate acetyltransferase [Bradyrhizobium sp.]